MSYASPRREQAPEGLDELLRGLYPSLDTGRLRWYRGLPWFLLPFGWVSGITLPPAWSRGAEQIYLRRWEPADPEWVALAVHEAFHALQMQEAARRFPWHWGSWHPFLLVYLASWTRHGYRRHPLELSAYQFEADFSEAFEDRENPEAWDDPSALAVLSRPVPRRLVRRLAGFAYGDAAWRLLPAALLLLPAGLIRLLGEGLDALGARRGE